MKKKNIFILFASLSVLIYFLYKKVLSYIFLNSDDSDEIFNAIKGRHNSFGHLLLYIGIALILISIVGIFITLHHFSQKPNRFKRGRGKKSGNFEDIYS